MDCSLVYKFATLFMKQNDWKLPSGATSVSIQKLPRVKLSCRLPHIIITLTLLSLSLSSLPLLLAPLARQNYSFLIRSVAPIPVSLSSSPEIMTDSVEPSTSSSAEDPNPSPNPNSLIHPRREPFEHGLLPIPKLIFSDPTQTLAPLKQKLAASSSTLRVDTASLVESLQISIDHARLVLDTLASVLHSESDPLARAKPDEIDFVGADLRDLILFLYIQSYKKLLPRAHKDSASVADVWPSTSAFDGYLSALSPLQVSFCWL